MEVSSLHPVRKTEDFKNGDRLQRFPFSIFPPEARQLPCKT